MFFPWLGGPRLSWTWLVNRLSGIYKICVESLKVCTLSWPLSKSKFNPKSRQPCCTGFSYRVSALFTQYSTNRDRKGWPGSEIQMYCGCPCICLIKTNEKWVIQVLDSKIIVNFSVKKQLLYFCYVKIDNCNFITSTFTCCFGSNNHI